MSEYIFDISQSQSDLCFHISFLLNSIFPIMHPKENGIIRVSGAQVLFIDFESLIKYTEIIESIAKPLEPTESILLIFLITETIKRIACNKFDIRPFLEFLKIIRESYMTGTSVLITRSYLVLLQETCESNFLLDINISEFSHDISASIREMQERFIRIAILQEGFMLMSNICHENKIERGIIGSEKEVDLPRFHQNTLEYKLVIYRRFFEPRSQTAILTKQEINYDSEESSCDEHEDQNSDGDYKFKICVLCFTIGLFCFFMPFYITIMLFDWGLVTINSQLILSIIRIAYMSYGKLLIFTPHIMCAFMSIIGISFYYLTRDRFNNQVKNKTYNILQQEHSPETKTITPSRVAAITQRRAETITPRKIDFKSPPR